MNKIMSGLTATALAALIGVTSIVPASAQILAPKSDQRDRVIQTYCDRNPRDRDCNSWRPGRWDDRDYDRFYSRRRGNLDSIASGIFGFTFGAIVGGALANQNQGRDRVIYLDDNGPGRRYSSYDDHVNACYDRYRSYDEETDTFLGYDGRRHRCQL
jgi:hypothetical protein